LRYVLEEADRLDTGYAEARYQKDIGKVIVLK
jgi:hypothetical protein